MGSVISYNIPDGGDGRCDRSELIGYCTETPIEVLKSVLMTHNVHYFCGLYTPIDNRYPNNISGLIINEFESGKGITITGKLEDLDLSEHMTDLVRTRKQILSDLDRNRKMHNYNNKKSIQYIRIIDEISEYVESLNLN